MRYAEIAGCFFYMDLELIVKEIFSETDFCKPDSAGVYMVCVKKRDEVTGYVGREKILYIGSSQNIRTRLSNPNHPYLQAYQRFNDISVYTRSYLTENYKQVESMLIKITCIDLFIF